MWRLRRKNFGGVGEELIGGHRIDLGLRRRLHVEARIDRADDWFGGLTPLRQRRDLVAGLDLVNGVVVGWAIGLRATDDPDVRRGRVDADHARGDCAAPARRDYRVIARLGPGRAPARRGENVGPHIEHRQQVIAPGGIGDRYDHRFLCQVEPGTRI